MDKPDEICIECGNTFKPCKPTSRLCSRLCANRSVSKRSAAKRGDIQRGRGEGKAYRKLNGRHEHRVVMEQKLGRSLKPGEIVHHIDGNRQNNHPDNLGLLPSQAEHARIHSTKNRKCEFAGCDRKHSAKGLCKFHYQRQWLKAQKGGV